MKRRTLVSKKKIGNENSFKKGKILSMLLKPATFDKSQKSWSDFTMVLKQKLSMDTILNFPILILAILVMYRKLLIVFDRAARRNSQ